MMPESEISMEEIAAETERPDPRVRDIESFETAKGSVYSYDDEGRTRRYKSATKELHDVQDLTLFLDIDEKKAQAILDAIHAHNDDPQKEKKVYALERDDHDQPRVIRTYDDIADPERLYIGIMQNGKLIGTEPASIRPAPGRTVFDTRQYRDDHGKMYTERHIGNKVTKITPRTTA